MLSAFNHHVAIAADWLTVASFILTIALLINSESLRKEISSQKKDYEQDKDSVKRKLIALRENLWDNTPLTSQIASEIRTLIYSIEERFGLLDKLKDKKHVKTTLRMLHNKPASISKEELCREIDYFIARLERREHE